MYHQAHSQDYETVYLRWPDMISPRCDLCNQKVKFAHAGNGKIIHTLNGDIHQVMYYYTCSNPKCENSSKYFNPAPRYDCSMRHYDQEVMDKISREIFIFKQTPQQIHLRLTLDYDVDISLRTVQRIYNEILLVKSKQIDHTTKKIISKNKGIILAMDAQDPGGGIDPIWMFTDAYSSRLLYTMQSASTPATKLHDTIEMILETYETTLLGAVSDKQNNNVKCMRDYYDGVRHQFCTYHFMRHLWDHMEMFDSQIYLPLSKVLNGLYIHKSNPDTSVSFEKIGKIPVKEVFEAMDGDLQKLLRYRNKTFKSLRGLALYRSLKRYVMGMEDQADGMDGSIRIEKIFMKTLKILKEAIHEVEHRFFQTLFMYDTFKVLYRLFYHEVLERDDKVQRIDEVFNHIWAVAQNIDPSLQFGELRSFNPRAKSTFVNVLGEWMRLWKSYESGLFAYYEFPKDIRTNTEQERGFGKEKMSLIKRSSKKEAGVLLELQGELYLRFCYCSDAELMAKISDDYMKTEVKILREEHRKKVKKMMDKWYYKGEMLVGAENVLKKYHPHWIS